MVANSKGTAPRSLRSCEINSLTLVPLRICVVRFLFKRPRVCTLVTEIASISVRLRRVSERRFCSYPRRNIGTSSITLSNWSTRQVATENRPEPPPRTDTNLDGWLRRSPSLNPGGSSNPVLGKPFPLSLRLRSSDFISCLEDLSTRAPSLTCF